MTSRDTYNASVKSAATSKTVAVLAAETAQQETINASGCNVGYTLQTGNYANFAAAVKAANAAKIAALNAAETAKQMAIHAAKDTLRAAGDFGPA